MFEKLNKLTTQLYPTGKAFSTPVVSDIYKLHQGFNDEFNQLVNDCLSLYDSLFPDNENFTEQDASYWEYNLGMQVSDGVSLNERKEAIKRKMSHPNNVLGRQSKSFIESQLRLAGFDVYVHENVPPYTTPADIPGAVAETRYGDNTRYGNNTKYGGGAVNLVANSVRDELYATGGNIWASFYIGGLNLGDRADVPSERKTEFRELILRLKPAHLVAYLIVNYN